MDTFALDVTSRSDQIKAKHVRLKGRIPAVYYGKGQKSQMLDMDYQSFRKIFSKAGENTIIELTLDGKKMPVLVYDIQYHPLSEAISHVDFIHVDMNKEVTTSVKITFVGVAPAVKNLAGVLDVQKHELKIRCLPKDLIQSLEVDVSPIVDFHTTIHVKDVKVPSTIKVLDNLEDSVVTVTPPREEEVEKPAEAAAVVVGAEGAAPAEGAAATGAAPAGAAAPAGKEKK